MRVIYININYDCNNRCVFCFSYTTDHFKVREFSMSSLDRVIRMYNINDKDRVVINGGEPLMYQELASVILKISELGAETVLYTNGRLLKDADLAESILKAGINRITIPVHGKETIHDALTKAKGSYSDTITGLNCLASFKRQYNFALEVKHIISTESCTGSFDVVQEMDAIGVHEFVDTYVLCGLVKTKTSDKYGYSVVAPDSVSSLVDDMLKRYLSRGIQFKLFDVELCKLSTEIQEHIVNHYDETLNMHMEKFIYLDSRCPEGRARKYSKYRSGEDCLKCDHRYKCFEILDYYGALYITENKIYLDLE